MVDWAQIHYQSSAAIIYRGPSCTLDFREKPKTGIPSLLQFLPPDLTLTREPQEQNLTSSTENFPIQLELHSFILICIFTGQSNWLHFNQPKYCFLDQSNCKYLESYSALEQTNQKLGLVTLHISQLHLCFSGAHFWFPSKSVSLANVAASAGTVTPELSCNNGAEF